MINNDLGFDWDVIREGFTSLTLEDREEIDFQVELICSVLEARKDKGITQAELDTLCGVKQTHIARIERGKADPQISTILKILKPLGKKLAVVDADFHSRA
jgi:DNA-binding XRE family transcriptional regulator